MFAFVGPATGTLRISPTVVRQGKSTSFIGVDLAGKAGLAVRGMLCFGATRASTLDHVGLAAPLLERHDNYLDLFITEGRPGFTRHFDGRLAASASGWWLLRNSAQAMAGGYSAQEMTIWDDPGRSVAAMRQTVAFFV